MGDKNIKIVFITLPDEATAESISEILIEERLAACINIIRGIHSIYRWEGKIEKATEVLILAKTTEECYPKLEQRVLALHPYSVPEIIAVNTTAGFEKYCSWIQEETAVNRF